MRTSNTSAKRRCALKLAIALFAGTPLAVAADDPALIDAPSNVVEAERLAEQAFEAYSQQQYHEAMALYEHAYAVAPSADALYNIARIYDVGLRDRAGAIAAYERFLAEPGAPAERVERAAERLNDLRRAERAEREAPARPRLERASPERLSLDRSSPEPSPYPPAAPRDGGSLSGLRAGALVVGGVGLASAVVGGAFGLSVLSNAARANEACEGNRCATQRGVDAAKTASSHATLATVGVSVGAVLLATGAVLWIVGDDAPSEPAVAASARLGVAPVASAGELGLALVGGF